MDNNELYVKKKLKELDIPKLTESQKQDLTDRIKVYRTNKEKIKEKIYWLKNEISGIEKELRKSILSTPGAPYIHKACELKSVHRLGSDINGEEWVFYCVYCETDFTMNSAFAVLRENDIVG